MKHRLRTSIAAAVGMLLMILDTKTALAGAKEGLNLCITTVIPSLLPFIFLSGLLTSAMAGTNTGILRFLGRLMRMPNGSESIFLTGILGGYPTGAQAVASAYSEGQLTVVDARRLLGFCSNAGPSFLFGITSSIFSDRLSPWILWMIHIISAILTAVFLPGGNSERVRLKPGKALTVTQALRQSVTAMAQICGWILLFRIGLAFLNRWFLWFPGKTAQVLINGITELTIGCVSLSDISRPGLQFILCSAFLGFGGLCVAMQTASVTGKLGLGMYIPGKILQCLISAAAAAAYQQLAFPRENRWNAGLEFYAAVLILIAIIVFFLQKTKNKCSIPAAVRV